MEHLPTGLACERVPIGEMPQLQVRAELLGELESMLEDRGRQREEATSRCSGRSAPRPAADRQDVSCIKFEATHTHREVKEQNISKEGVLMKKTFITLSIVFFIAVSAVSAHADLDNFLSNLNIQAKSNMNGFGVKLSTQFGVPLPKVQAIIKTVEFPAHAFMCLQLSLMTNIQLEIVLQTYKNNKGKGWGAIAKKLGIKPGSAEFHALKRGDFIFTGERSRKTVKGQGKSKVKGKGRKK